MLQPVYKWIARIAIVAASIGNTAVPRSGPLDFEVKLDGRAIGVHRFERVENQQGLRVISDAKFEVRILGIRFYSYRHHAVEHWENGCLHSLEASTDDNGKKVQVVAGSAGGVLTVSDPAGEAQHGCSFSYAYWDRRIVDQHRLLNPQTGHFDSVQIEPKGFETITVRGRPSTAERFRLVTARLTIDLWYSMSGDWLQLDSMTQDGKRLQYRLRP
jgi:Family of unknown function (DUF6134)